MREERSLSHRFLHERGDPCLFGGSQPLQREGDRPHGAFVEVRLVAEAERRVPRLELVCALEEADNMASLAYAGIPYQVLGERAARGGAFYGEGKGPHRTP